MRITWLFVCVATAISSLFSGEPAKADSLSFNTAVTQGQGVAGSIQLHLDWTAGGDLLVTVDQVSLTYMQGAGLNNLDASGGNLEVRGLWLVPQADGTASDKDNPLLMPLANFHSNDGTYACTICGSALVPKETLARSDSLLHSVIVNDTILFLEDMGRLPVKDPIAPGDSAIDFPVPDGDYAVFQDLCPPGIPDPVAKYGTEVWDLAVWIEYPNMAWFEQGCEINSFRNEARDLVVDLTCSIEGRSKPRTLRLIPNGTTGFTSDGKDFKPCDGTPGNGSLAEIARRANLPLASLPNLQDLQAEDFSLLQSALDGIEAEATLNAATKSVLATAVTQAANMAFSPALQKFVFEKFGLQSQIIFKGIVANPVAYAQDAGDGASADLIKGIAIGVAGSMAADTVFSLKPLADLPPEWKAPMHAMVKATVVETINLGTSAIDPSLAAAGIANRLYEFYEIYKASVGVADIQNDAAVAAAISLETAARLVNLNPSDKNSEIARATLADAVTNLNQAFGDGYTVAMTEIVNLTFVGILSELRSDHDRALRLVANIREKGALGADDALPSPLSHPINWIASLASWSGDPPSRVAALMISATVLGNVEVGEPADVEVIPPVEPPVAVEPAPLPVTSDADRWGPDIVPGVEVGYNPCGQRSTDDRCLRELGLSDAAIAFSFAVAGDYSGLAMAKSFQDLGAVDLAVAEFIGANSWYEAVLLNGPPGLVSIEGTTDLRTTFSDVESKRLLQEYPGAASFATGYYTPVSAHRILADGTQRFVQIEMVNDGCHACAPIGTAITFLDIGPATGNQVLRRPIGIGYDPSLPGMDMNLSPQVLSDTPSLLQFYLNKFGYDAGSMDGYPGPQTRQALLEFQVEHCLTPTGQMTPETADALWSADHFAAPCAGSRLPPGIAANTPILSGVYVDAPEKCLLEQLPEIDQFVSLQIIDGLNQKLAGPDNTCRVIRTDMIKGLTKFSAECTVEGSEWGKTDWLVDILANDRYDEVQGASSERRSFSRCGDDTPLHRTYIDPQSAPVSAAVPAPTTVQEPDNRNTPARIGDAAPQPIGDTVDLFNLIGSQLERPCASRCNVDGVAGKYLVTEFKTDRIRPQDILAVNDLHYEQGVPRMLPPEFSEGYPPLDQLGGYRLWFVEWSDCGAVECPSAVVALLQEAVESYHEQPGYSGPAGRLLDMRPGFSIDGVAAGDMLAGTTADVAPPPDKTPQTAPAQPPRSELVGDGNVIDHNRLTAEDIVVLSTLLPPYGYGSEDYSCGDHVQASDAQGRAIAMSDLPFSEQVALQKRMDECFVRRSDLASAFSKKLGKGGRFVIVLTVPLTVTDTDLNNIPGVGRGVEITACGVPRVIAGSVGDLKSHTQIQFDLPGRSRLNELRSFKGPQSVSLLFKMTGDDCPVSNSMNSSWRPVGGLELHVQDTIELRVSDLDLGARLDSEFRSRGILADIACVALVKDVNGHYPVCVISSLVLRYGDGEVFGVQEIAIAQ